jgi:ankyrin repeat protein
MKLGRRYCATIAAPELLTGGTNSIRRRSCLDRCASEVGDKMKQAGSPGTTSVHFAIAQRGPGNGETDLYQAAAAGDAETVRRLLGAGVDVNCLVDISSPTPSFNVSPLMAAAEAGHVNIVFLLLWHDAEVNAQDSVGWTPLMRAAAGRHIEVARLLLAYGADVYRKNDAGETALTWAQNKGATDIVELLIEAGAYFTRCVRPAASARTHTGPALSPWRRSNAPPSS